MKHFLYLALIATLTTISCSKFDDSAIWEKLGNHETRISELERLCKEMNEDIINLQTLITALETDDYIINASPLVTGDGYTFVFKSGKSVVIYNGKDGANGTNGENGVTPEIGVKQDTDGFYYWTINGEWLIVDGNKVRASAIDGKDGSNGTNGTNGVNGITPQFKITDNYWYISYDNGKTWEKLGKASGDNGLNGSNGDSFFKGVYIENSYVSFILNDGKNTIINIPFYTSSELVIEDNIPGDLKNRITNEQKRQLISLTITGGLSTADMEFINTQMLALENLDIHGCIVDPKFFLNPYQDVLVNRTIRNLTAPFIKKTSESTHYMNCSYATNLEKITIHQDSVRVYTSTSPWKIYPVMTPNLKTIEYAEGVKRASTNVGYCESVILSSTIEYVTYELMTSASDAKLLSDIYCYAQTPPSVGYNESATKWVEKEFSTPKTEVTIHVPEASIDLYKTANVWKTFADKIVPITSNTSTK